MALFLTYLFYFDKIISQLKDFQDSVLI